MAVWPTKENQFNLKLNNGIVVDKVKFLDTTPWPEIANGEAITLKSADLDNHFAANWKSVNLDVMVFVDQTTVSNNINVYPNPTTGNLTISGLNDKEMMLNVYDLTGGLVKSQIVNSTHSRINIQDLQQGIYLFRCGNYSSRVILMK